MYVGVNPLSAALVFGTAVIYVLVYTPLKRYSWWNTPVGAIPGAMPPMVGWAAASGRIDAGAWNYILKNTTAEELHKVISATWGDYMAAIKVRAPS